LKKIHSDSGDTVNLYQHNHKAVGILNYCEC